MNNQQENRFAISKPCYYSEVADERHIEREKTLWRKTKRSVAEWWYTSALCNWVCCTDPGDHLDYLKEMRTRKQVRESLLVSLSYGGSRSIVAATIEDVREHEGYDMCMEEVPPEMAKAVVGTTEVGSESLAIADAPGTDSKSDGGCTRANCDAPSRSDVVKALLKNRGGKERGQAYNALLKEFEAALLNKHNEQVKPKDVVPVAVVVPRMVQKAQIIPRFVAAVVAALRSKLGQLPQNVPGNALIVTREALRIMREYNVRELDRTTHLPYIESCYWDEDVHYKIPTVRSRMSKFHRWLMYGKKQVPNYALPSA